MNEESIAKLPTLICDLFRTVGELNRLFPDRPFTPDGHLVGSIGEVVAAWLYDLSLEKCSNQGFDAYTLDNRKVEIKLTGANSVSVASDSHPDILLVFQLTQSAGFRKIYNGEFPAEYCSKLNRTKRHVFQGSLFKLSDMRPKRPALTPCDGRSLNDLNRFFPDAAKNLTGLRSAR